MAAEIPQSLRDEEFQDMWTLYLTYSRSEHRAIGEIQQSVLLMRLGRWGLGRAVEALEHTMANGWKCVREPDSQGAISGSPNRQRPRNAAERNEQANADAFAALRSQIPDRP